MDDNELRKLQQAHEKALRAAQRHEDTRRKRLHMTENEVQQRQLLTQTLREKREQVLTNSSKQRQRVRKKLARRNRLVQKRVAATAQKHRQIVKQRADKLHETQERNAERNRARQLKLKEYAARRRRMNAFAMKRAQASRERRDKEGVLQSKQIAERIDARLSQTEKSHKSVIAARKSAKGAKNRKWLQRVKVTKAMPDSRSVATEARIRAKYQKIEDRKKAAQALQRHKKMLQDKLKFQQEQWRKEYNPAQGLKKPTHARIHSGSRIRKSDVKRAFPESPSPSSRRPSSAGLLRSPHKYSAGTP